MCCDLRITGPRSLLVTATSPFRTGCCDDGRRQAWAPSCDGVPRLCLRIVRRISPPRCLRCRASGRRRRARPPRRGRSRTPRPSPARRSPSTWSPSPGGSFKMGSPADGEGAQEGRGPAARGHGAAVLHGQTRGDLGRLPPVPRPRHQAGRWPAAATTKPDALTYPTPPYADETFGLGRGKTPNIAVTWHAAMEFARWISSKTGKSYRLPTEAEWEYACRAGTATAYAFGDRPGQAGRPRLVRGATPQEARTPSAASSPMLSASSTCTATCQSGCSIATPPDFYAKPARRAVAGQPAGRRALPARRARRQLEGDGRRPALRRASLLGADLEQAGPPDPAEYLVAYRGDGGRIPPRSRARRVPGSARLPIEDDQGQPEQVMPTQQGPTQQGEEHERRREQSIDGGRRDLLQDRASPARRCWPATAA